MDGQAVSWGGGRIIEKTVEHEQDDGDDVSECGGGTGFPDRLAAFAGPCRSSAGPVEQAWRAGGNPRQLFG